MIRKLMASSAMLALMTAGSLGIAQAQTQPVDPAQQPPMVQDQQNTDAQTTGAQSADQPTAEIAQSDTSLTPDQPTLASAFMGKSVFSNENQEADNIGEVNDLIVSSDGSITHAVIGVGGFLGIGEKSVAVPFDELQVVEREGDIRLIYAATREQLEQAQAFDSATYSPQGRQQEQQEQQNAAANQAMDPNAPAGAAGGAAMTATQPAPAAGATAEQQAQTAQTAPDASSAQQAAESQSTATMEGFTSFSATDQIRASNLMGREIYGAENESIGEVGDLAMQQDGSTRAAIIDVGGFLGIGEKQVAIPFDQIQMTQEGNEPRLTVAMTREQLEQAPAYQAPQEAAADQTNTATGMPTNTTDQQAAGTQPPAGADQQAAQQQQPADQQQANAQPQFTPATQEISAENLMGQEVVSSQDENLGEVDDVVFTPKGEIQAVVVDVGGFLGIGEKSVAINFDQLNVQKDTNGDLRLQVNATQEQLQNAPAYNAEQAAAQ